MTQSWPPPLTAIHTPCKTEPSKFPFPTKVRFFLFYSSICFKVTVYTNGIINFLFFFLLQDSHPFPSEYYTLLNIYMWLFRNGYLNIGWTDAFCFFCRARKFFQELKQPPAQNLWWPANVSASSLFTTSPDIFRSVIGIWKTDFRVPRQS